MAKKNHYLKTEIIYYQSVKAGLKKFELRKNDRDYKVGDTIVLLEVKNGNSTGNQLLPCEIKYILTGGVYGLDKDYCIIGF